MTTAVLLVNLAGFAAIINRSTKLPEGETVTVEFTPNAPGEIPFQCQMGMLRGKVVVTE